MNCEQEIVATVQSTLGQKREPAAMTESRKRFILFLAGFCLVLLQFFMIRDITALLRGTEMVIFFVVAAYFFGYSVGYGVSEFLSLGTIRRLALGFWLIHLTLPFSLRYGMGLMVDTVPGAAFFALLFFTAFMLTTFYSLLLPRFIDLSERGPGALAGMYGAELLGAVTGVAAVFLFGSVPWTQPLLYQIALAAIVVTLIDNRILWAAAVIALVFYAALYPSLQRDSISYHYEKAHHIKGSRTLYSVNSPYQKVDIIENASGRRYIFLNGNQNFGSTSLSLFNTFLSKLPAVLIRPENVLIVGAGSMQSVRHTAPIAGKVDVVEIDRAVPDGSRIHLKDINQLDRFSNWTLHIDDAKRYLGGTDERYDLIVMDVPAPLTIQVALLHSVGFYRLAKQHLTPRGVMSISLSGAFKRKNTTPRTVAAAALEVFEDVAIITPEVAERSFALAGRSLPFTHDRLRRAAALLGAGKARIFGIDEARAIVGDMPPISIENIRYPVKRSWRRVKKRFFK